MSAAHTICLGTIGSGIWRSEDGGQSWANIRDGIWNDSNIYSLTADPTDSRVIYAGTQEGIFRSDDRAVSFRKLEGPLDNYQVWAIAVDPSDPTTVMAGCGPSAFFRTRDAGRTWEKMNVPLAESCPNVREPRATALVIDPNDSRIVWAGIEVDGVRRSLDGGDSWTPIGATAMGEADIGEGIWDPDIHDIVVTRGAPSMVITSTPKEIFTSTDLGESWSPLKVKESFPTMYCRPMALKENDSKRALSWATATAPSATPAPSSAPRTKARRGRPATCQWSPTRASGASPPTPPTPTWSTPAATSAKSTPATTAATPGTSCAATSAKSGR